MIIHQCYTSLLVEVKQVRVYVAIFLLVAGSVGSLSVAGDRVIRFGTGGDEGSYHPIGSLIAHTINASRVGNEGPASSEPLVVIPQRSSGSVSNLIDISENLLEAGLAQADVASLAFHGTGQFANTAAPGKLRTIGSLYHESVHLVASIESGIQNFKDLTGKRVSVDELGSGTQLDVEPMLAAHNMTAEAFSAVYLKPADSIERMRRGQLDAFFAIAGYPLEGVKELIDDGIGRFVLLDRRVINELTEKYLFFSSHTIPADVYVNEKAIETLSVTAQLIVRADLDVATVYDITRTLWTDASLHALKQGHPRGGDIKAELALQGIGIPLHSGAYKYYSEQGFDIESVSH